MLYLIFSSQGKYWRKSTVSSILLSIYKLILNFSPTHLLINTADFVCTQSAVLALRLYSSHRNLHM